MRCYCCPLKWTCALWLFDVWNVNCGLCNCTDERLIALDNPFEVDLVLLNNFKMKNKEI
jgi:hypothetical protein